MRWKVGQRVTTFKMLQTTAKESHLIALCAWNSNTHLPITPAQLMRHETCPEQCITSRLIFFQGDAVIYRDMCMGCTTFLTFPQSMQHCLVFPVCAHSLEEWEGRLGPLRHKGSSLQWIAPSMLLHRTTVSRKYCSHMLYDLTISCFACMHTVKTKMSWPKVCCFSWMLDTIKVLVWVSYKCCLR